MCNRWGEREKKKMRREKKKRKQLLSWLLKAHLDSFRRLWLCSCQWRFPRWSWGWDKFCQPFHRQEWRSEQSSDTRQCFGPACRLFSWSAVSRSLEKQQQVIVIPQNAATGRRTARIRQMVRVRWLKTVWALASACWRLSAAIFTAPGAHPAGQPIASVAGSRGSAHAQESGAGDPGRWQRGGTPSLLPSLLLERLPGMAFLLLREIVLIISAHSRTSPPTPVLDNNSPIKSRATVSRLPAELREQWRHIKVRQTSQL